MRLVGDQVSYLEYSALLDALLGPERDSRPPRNPDFFARADQAVSPDEIRALVTAANAQPAPMEPRVNDTLGDGRWRLQHELARGGFARVWLAYGGEKEPKVAVKVHFNQAAQDRSKVARFFRGAQVMAELEHPNVARVVDAGRIQGGVGYYVMAYANGGDLGERIKSRALTWQEGAALAREVGGALAHVHARGRVHRDVKPENILYDEGRALLTDFDPVFDPKVTKYTLEGAGTGTAFYGAPEALFGEAVDQRADVYSFAKTLVAALAGPRISRSRLFDDPAGCVAELDAPERVKEQLRLALRPVQDRTPGIEGLLRAFREPASETPPRSPTSGAGSVEVLVPRPPPRHDRASGSPPAVDAVNAPAARAGMGPADGDLARAPGARPKPWPVSDRRLLGAVALLGLGLVLGAARRTPRAHPRPRAGEEALR